jgi:hypothetical protein
VSHVHNKDIINKGSGESIVDKERGDQ